MHSMTRRTALASGAALASTAVLASCGGGDDDAETLEKIDNPDENINSEGMPIVDEQVTITLMSARPTTTAEDWNEIFRDSGDRGAHQRPRRLRAGAPGRCG